MTKIFDWVNAVVDSDADEDMSNGEVSHPSATNQNQLCSAPVLSEPEADDEQKMKFEMETLQLYESEQEVDAFHTNDIVTASDSKSSKLASLQHQSREKDRKSSRHYSEAKKQIPFRQKGAAPSKITKATTKARPARTLGQKIEDRLMAGGAAAYKEMREEMDRSGRETSSTDGTSKSIWGEHNSGADEQLLSRQKEIIINKMNELLESEYHFKERMQEARRAAYEYIIAHRDAVDAVDSEDRKRRVKAAEERGAECIRKLETDIRAARNARAAKKDTYEMGGLAFRPR